MRMIIVLLALASSMTIAFSKDKAAAEYKVTVTDNGFEPSNFTVKSGVPLVFKITRKTNATCAREFTVPSQKLKVDLPLNKEVTVKMAALSKGEVKFGCAMDLMIGGVMNVQ